MDGYIDRHRERFILKNLLPRLQRVNREGKSWKSSSKAVCWQNSLCLGKISLFVLRLSTDWIRPPNVMESNVLLKVYQYKCSSHSKKPSQTHLASYLVKYLSTMSSPSWHMKLTISFLILQYWLMTSCQLPQALGILKWKHGFCPQGGHSIEQGHAQCLPHRRIVRYKGQNGTMAASIVLLNAIGTGAQVSICTLRLKE